ncbi:hypothetical protein HYQ46_009484 [Verticillium longisporum]|nr:hypothetical protein HYQ44_010400 [Verticillium longisporum]KAG7132425.1 hypothetical protein HYQ46_009484 [Verticillium longisporum]
MQRADSPGPTELDGLIERAYQEFADVTELLADEQRDAEAAASAEVPVLQQMIDLKQKEVEQLEPRASIGGTEGCPLGLWRNFFLLLAHSISVNRGFRAPSCAIPSGQPRYHNRRQGNHRVS